MIEMFRGLTEIKSCYSGVLATGPRNSLMRHLAMATESALGRLEQDKQLQQTLTELYQRDPTPLHHELHEALSQGNVCAEIYGSRLNWLTFGLYTEAPGDAEKFRAAITMLSKREAGIHRAFFWAIHGIRINQELVDCRPGQYGRAIHLLFDRHGTEIDKVIEFNLTKKVLFEPVKRTRTGFIVNISWGSVENNFEQKQRFPLPIEPLYIKQHPELI